jgi:hypothetical protein
MPAQSPLLSVVQSLPQAPGAQVLTPTQLSLDDLVEVITAGAVSTVTTLRSLQSFGLGGIGSVRSRVVQQAAQAVFSLADVCLLINLQAPAPLTIPLPVPVDPNATGSSRLIMIKDMARNAGVNAITLDAGAGNLIESQQTLVMNANGEMTVLISESATLCGVWT